MVIQAEYRLGKNNVQLDNGIVLTNLKNSTDLFPSLKEVVIRYASTVAVNVTPLLETHVVQSIMYQKHLMKCGWERLCSKGNYKDSSFDD